MSNVFLDKLAALSAPWAGTMGRACWQGAIALALAWVVCRCCGTKLPARLRPWPWRLASLKLLVALLPATPLLLPILPASHPTAVETRLQVTYDDAHSSIVADENRPAPAHLLSPHRDNTVPGIKRDVEKPMPLETSPIPATASRDTMARVGSRPAPPLMVSQHGAARWGMVALFIGWLCGLGWQGVRLLRDWRRVQTLRGACSPIQEQKIQSALQGLCHRLRVQRAPVVLQSSDGGPLLTGFLRPAIVLPASLLERFSDEDLHLVLAHETAHLKRRDLFWNLLEAAVSVLFWFHPLVWLARREWHRTSEEACDEMTLNATDAPIADYGAMLLRVAAHCTTPVSSSLSTVCLAEEYSMLRERLVALKEVQRPSRRALRLAISLLFVSGVAGLVPWRMTARAQEAAASTETTTVGAKATLSANPASSTAIAPRLIKGRVIGPGGKPMAGATVFVMPFTSNGHAPLAQTKTDANGVFQMREPRELHFGVHLERTYPAQILVDGGRRGFWYYRYLQPVPLTLHVPAPSTLLLTFQDELGHPARNLDVRIRRLGPNQLSWLSLPPQMLNRMRGRTDARGRVVFSGLSQGLVAQLTLSDERVHPSKLDKGDRRGGKYAPLSSEDYVSISKTFQQKTIRLLTPASVSGRVVFRPTGKPAPGLFVAARRVNAAEQRGDNTLRDYAIATTQTDGQGRYTLSSLRPGSYVLWASLPENLRQEWTSVNPETVLRARTKNIVNFELIKGAVIEGRVVAEATGKPVAGQYMGLFDAEENYRYAVSGKDGSFRLRAVGGKQHLWVHGNSISPPPGFMMPAKKEFDFSVANNQVYRVTVRLPGAPVLRPVTGRVVDEGGTPVPNAQVSVEGFGGFRDYGVRRVLQTDATGHFMAPAKMAVRPMRLWARAGEKQSPEGTIALSGDDVTLHVQENAAVALTGRVTDSKSGKPIAGSLVKLLRNAGGNVFTNAADIATDADGRFQFAGQRPRTAFMIIVKSEGYERMDTIISPAQPGASVEKTFLLRRADSFVAGQVLRADGQPAAGIQVSASGAAQWITTDGAGRFRFPHVRSGRIGISVTGDYGSNPRTDIMTTAGRSDVRIVLARQNAGESDVSKYREKWRRLQEQQQALVGKAAPEIVADGWSISQPLSLRQLRGQVVLLDFFYDYSFAGSVFGPDPAMKELATRFTSRGLRIIGIEVVARKSFPLPQEATSNKRGMPWTVAKEQGITYPLALDRAQTGLATPLDPTGFLSTTALRYRGATSVVIDRTGRVAYAGDSLSEAVTTITGLLAK